MLANLNMIKELLLSDIVKNQAVLNIGCIGHVSNGKSTLVRKMTGIKTQKFKSEKERNCTINVGYGNCKIFYSPTSNEFKYTGSGTESMVDSKGNIMILINHISFVDCPGHENYMSNMLCGTSVIDMAFLVEAANASVIPQPQTLEHLMAIQNMDISDIVVLQNKCDLVNKQELEFNKLAIEDFIEDYYDDPLPIIPIIAQSGCNIDYIGKYLMKSIRKYNKDISKPLQINIIRTFDINKPKQNVNNLKGGIFGGSIVQGILTKDEIIQISPGICIRDKDKWKVKPLFTKINSINSEKNSMDYAIAGGLIGIGTLIDPSYTKANQLVGHIITKPGLNLDIVDEVLIKYKTFKRICKIDKTLKKGEILKLGIICKHIKGVVKSWNKKDKEVLVTLSSPVCIDKKPISIIKMIDKKFKLFSIGKIIKSHKIKVDIPEKYKNNKSINYSIKNDIIFENNDESFTYSYEEMAKSINNQVLKRYKLKVPTPIITRTKNGSQQIIENYIKILESFKNDKDSINSEILFEKFLMDSISCPVNGNDKKKLLIHGKVKNTAIINSINKNIIKIRKCIVCKGYNTFITKNNRLLYINCEECKSVNAIS